MRRSTVLALALAAVTGIGTATAGGPARRRLSPAEARQGTIASATAKRTAWRAALRQAGERLDPRRSLYHQIPNPEHRAGWERAIARTQGRPAARLAVVKQWIKTGRYPGIWTVEDANGWYGQKTSGEPIEIRLAEDMVLYDADRPEHVAVYREWRAEEAARGAEPNEFEDTLNDRGLSLADRASGVRAPRHEKFYRDLGIAGVTWYDAQGVKCVVLFNAEAIADVRFPGEKPAAAKPAAAAEPATTL